MAFPKKKLTKKELKAQNHAKLMASRKSHAMPSQPNNVVQLNPGINQVEKKAA